jgi:hypothetical protein
MEQAINIRMDPELRASAREAGAADAKQEKNPTHFI